MVINSLRNFFRCLAWVFIPLGCVFLGFLLGVQMLLGGLAAQAAYISQELAEVIEGTQAQADNLLGFVIASLRSLDWSEPMQTVAYLMEGSWISARIAEFLQLTVEEAALLQERIGRIASDVSQQLVADLVMLIVCVVLGMVLGYFVTNCFVRRSTVRRGFWGFLIASAADAVLTATIITFVTWLLAYSKAGAVISAVVSAVVFGSVSLFEAYLVHARGKIPFRAVVNLRHCLYLSLSEIAVYAAAALICLVIMLLTSSFVAFALVLSVIIIAMLVTNVNAESYTQGLVKEEDRRQRRIRTYASLGGVSKRLRTALAFDETLSDQAEKGGIL